MIIIAIAWSCLQNFNRSLDRLSRIVRRVHDLKHLPINLS
jgi:hypothetical protein